VAVSAKHAVRIAIHRTLAVAALVLAGQLALVENSDAQVKSAGARPFPTVRLAAKARGASIPEALGARLADVAAFYGMSTSELEQHARSDRAMFADVDGRLGYACEGLVIGSRPAQEGATVEQSPYPLDRTFTLHSLAGANRVIFLDFDGNVTTGTLWNSNYHGGNAIVTPAYDTDGNPSSFGDTEKAAIQEIWQRVSEDFAPFEIDVTTEDPGLERLRKTASSDLNYGQRVCIGGSSTDWYGAGAGGVSYIGSFNWSSDTPNFVFPAQLGNGYAKYVAEAASHETGHALGLSHDGTTTGTEYYSGQGDWAPIMGVGYYVNTVQWSKGEYANANNKQDDLTVMQSYGAAVKYSDYGNTRTDAFVMAPGPSFGAGGTIETAADVDAFEFSSGPGTIYLNVQVASPSPNLDVLARVFDSNGNLVASSNPASMGLALSATVPMGNYVVMLEGVGSGDPVTNGYSDYASVGNYILTGNVPDPNNIATPDAVASADPTSGVAPLAVAFSSAGSSAPSNGTLVGFDWDFGDGSPHSSEPNPAHTFTVGGNFACVLTVTSDNGMAGFDTVWVSVQGAPLSPSNLVAAAGCDPTNPGASAIVLGWVDNSSNEDGFEVEESADGVHFAPARAAVGGASFTRTGLDHGITISFRVRAVNAFGSSGYSNVASATTNAAPTEVPGLAAATVSSSSIQLTWSNVANETGFELQRSLDGVSGWTTIAQPAVDIIACYDTGRLSLTQYFYRIRALGPCSFAAGFSNTAQAMTSGTITAPGSLAAKPSSWTRVNLTWVDKSNNEWGFKVQRSTSSSFSPATEFSVGANAVSLADSSVAPKTLYYYRVRAFAGTVSSSWTSSVKVTMPADSTKLLPLAPSRPTLTTSAGPKILVKWVDYSVYEDGFSIERSTSSTFLPVTLITVGKNVISYVDSVGLTKGVKYYYRLRSFNAAGFSAYTSSVSITASTATPTASPAAASEAPESSASVDEAPAMLQLRNAAPNPFRDRSTIGFDLPAAAAVDLAIFDVSGRRIAGLASGVWQAGSHRVQWDGRDDRGRVQAPGVFFARLSIGRQVMVRKVVLAR
jgi:PKD repeat protein